MGRNVDNIGGVAQAAANLGSPVNRRNIRFLDGGGITWTVVDDPGNDEVEVTASAGGAGVPVGTVVAKASTVVPAGWLECDGSSQLVASFPALFADIGYTYGGAGANFNLPSTSRRVLMGRGGAGTAIIGNTVGAVGGEEDHTQTVAEMVNHGHSTGGGGHNHDTHNDGFGNQIYDMAYVGAGPGGWPGIMYRATSLLVNTSSKTSTDGAGISVNANGSSTPANVIQPAMIVMWIIKT
jgi:microcystin-dependent protein